MSDFRSFPTARRAPAIAGQPLIDPAGWDPAALANVSDWAYRITEEDAAEIVNAVDTFRRTGAEIIEVGRDNFPLPRLGAVLADVRRELIEGRGMVMIRNFPVDRLDRAGVATAYLGLGAYVGERTLQNRDGHMLGHVKDVGGDYGVERGYSTNAELRFHADGCDYVGLLCLATAKSGGESRVASSVTVYNRILAERPELIEVLTQDFYRTNNGEETQGDEPWFKQPVFSFHEGYMSAMGLGTTIEKAQKLAGVPKLTATQLDAIKFHRDMVSRCAVDIPFEAGDIQLLNNYGMLHSRRSFEDWPEIERKRHLLRLWLRDPTGRPISEQLRQGRAGRGIHIHGLKLVVPLDVEQRKPMAVG